MIDVTELVQRYRLALRYVWNSCIWVDADRRNWESFYVFRDLKLPLFEALVASPLSLETTQIFGDQFHIVPRDVEFPSLPVNRRPADDLAGGVYEDAKGSLVTGNLSLTLGDLFDWLPLDYIDLSYYVARVREFSGSPELVGHSALVEAAYCKVLYDDSAGSEDSVPSLRLGNSNS